MPPASRDGRDASRQGQAPAPGTRHPRLGLLFPLLLLVPGVLLALVPGAARGQLKPNDSWRTIRTPHFAVHFTPPLEQAARLAAAQAERAYAQLSADLVPPRGTIDLVVADNVDFTNGYATPLPTNRVVVYAHPPVDVLSLRLYDQWSALVITHELTHIFHLDRSRGWWRAAQYVFGRNGALFPNLYAPAWVTEGLAVYEESRLTGYGRLAGSPHRMVARASALANDVPRLDQLSLATPRFPRGDAAYAYGSLLVDHLARTRGPERVRRFVERSSAQPVPFFLNRAARRTFGVTFQRAWREWRDSLRREAAADATAGGGVGRPLPRWRDLTSGGWFALYPRWADTATLVYAGNTGRAVPAAYAVAADGRRAPRALGRRNGVEPNVPLPGGGLLYAQLDYTSPYELRSDLYAERGGRVRRLTRGARLSAPDARASDGEIVAVQAVPATTRLVRVSADGRRVAALTPPSAATQWAEPRWSPDGSRVAATRITGDGHSEIVVLDTAGRVTRIVSRSGAVESSPSWSQRGDSIYFTSDRTGRTEIYVAAAAPAERTDSATRPAADSSAAGSSPAPPPPRMVSRAAAGVFYPAPSPDGRWIAGVDFKADGYYVGVAPLDSVSRFETAAAAAVPPPRPPNAPDQAGVSSAPAGRAAGADAVLAPVAARARRYSPWVGLLPRYWLPLVGRTDENLTTVGAFTSGSDVIGRHEYTLDVTTPTRKPGEIEASLGYRYAGLGLPLVDVSLIEYWDHYGVVSADGRQQPLGVLTRRTRAASVAATVLRPRVRSYASASAGVAYEARDFATDPAPLLGRLEGSDFFASRPHYPALFASASWSNTRVPSLGISPEDGVSLSASARDRWLRGGEGGSASHARTVVGVARAYKSLDLPGYAHHVLAARLAGGLASAAADELEAGGTSGSAIELLPGFVVGDHQRAFGVRGFPADAVRGLRAVGGTLEYRAPLTTPARGAGPLPLFLARTSAAAFVEGATAWCPPSVAASCLSRDSRRRTIAAAGAELSLDLALQYDAPYRFRLGLATPVTGSEWFGKNRVAGYVTLGLAF